MQGRRYEVGECLVDEVVGLDFDGKTAVLSLTPGYTIPTASGQFLRIANETVDVTGGTFNLTTIGRLTPTDILLKSTADTPKTVLLSSDAFGSLTLTSTAATSRIRFITDSGGGETGVFVKLDDNEAPPHFELVPAAAQGIYCFEDSSDGQNPEFRVNGHPTAGLRRHGLFMIERFGAEPEVAFKIATNADRIWLAGDVAFDAGLIAGTTGFMSFGSVGTGIHLPGYTDAVTNIIQANIYDDATNMSRGIDFRMFHPGQIGGTATVIGILGSARFANASDSDTYNILDMQAIRAPLWIAPISNDATSTVSAMSACQSRVRIDHASYTGCDSTVSLANHFHAPSPEFVGSGDMSIPVLAAFYDAGQAHVNVVQAWGLAINTDSYVNATLAIGDIGNTNQTFIEADGTIRFDGDATVFEDIVISLSAAKVPASNAPTWSGFIGNLNAYTYGLNDFSIYCSSPIEYITKSSRCLIIY